MRRIQKFIISFFMTITCVTTLPAYAWTSEGNGWINGTMGWSYMINGIYSDGWNNIDGEWYYFYKDTNFMAHDTIIDGYYINSDGVWIENAPDPIEQIIKNDKDYLDNTFKDIQWSFYTDENVSLKEICNEYWDVPDIVGNMYWIQDRDIDLLGYFVSGDNVYCLANQGGTDIYKIENGKIIESIPYEISNSYSWRKI
ncbi:cell wall-binding protein [Clostridium butyricum]|uniref:cell wall-binding protein n=1 Tax=Clostridium butyricum TaxID=1492 RepID=UPI00325AFBAD